jgi:hypothetical protein
MAYVYHQELMLQRCRDVSGEGAACVGALPCHAEARTRAHAHNPRSHPHPRKPSPDPTFLSQATRATGHPVGSVCAVMDLKGVRAPSFAFFKVNRWKPGPLRAHSNH